MSLHAASYFAGVGTVVATMAIGFGGGVMLTDAFVGKSEKTPTLMERRAAPLAESTAPVVAVAPAPPAEQQVASPSAPPPPQVSAQQTTATPLATASQAVTSSQAAPQPTTAVTQPTGPEPVTQDRARLEQSMARMHEADLRGQDAEARKAEVAERRKQERRKWAERRKRDMQKIDELTAVSEKVKQAERQREREPVFRSFSAESPGVPRLPVVNLFGGGDDD